jgi:hypothetical protein
MIDSMTLADIPAANTWNTTLAYGGYGDAFALARALNTVLTGSAWAAAVTVGGGWTGNFATLSWGSSVSTLFQNLPAVERASVAVAYAALFSTSLSNAIANETTLSVGSIPVWSYSAENNNAYLTGDKTNQGKRPIPVTALTMVQMAGGLAVGIVQGAVGEIVNLATLAYCLATAPITTATQIYTGIQEFVKTATTSTITKTASVLCPSFAQVCTLASQGQLVSYQGGVALGQMISQIVLNATINLATGGTGGLLGAVFGVLKTGLKLAAQSAVALTQAALKLAAPVLSAAAKVSGQVAIVARATVSLVRNAGAALGNALATNVGAPLKALLQRVTPRKQIGCFVAGTPLLTPTGSKRIEVFEPGDWVLSREENNPEGKIEAKRVEEVFIREALVLSIRAGGEEIETTAEHPFWVRGMGWINAGELHTGNELLSADGRWITLERVQDLGKIETVYNLRIADYHTYFLGCEHWGFSVWSHNTANLPGGCAVQVGLRGWSNQIAQFGKNWFRIDKKALKHILERHHPKYFDPAEAVGKQITTLLDKRLTPQSIVTIIREVMKQNREILAAPGASQLPRLKIEGVVDGIKYVVGFKFGRVGQFYPE